MPHTPKQRTLAIHYGHNASVAVAEDGAIVFAISEERLNRIKNSTGFPLKSYEYVQKHFPGEFDCYAISSGEYSWGYHFIRKHGFTSFRPGEYYSEKEHHKTWLQALLPQRYYARELHSQLIANPREERNAQGRAEMRDYFAKLLAVPAEKILFVNHHAAHAFSSLYFIPAKDQNKDFLLFTLDGEGDGLCATVSRYSDGKVETLSKTNRAYSLGRLYIEITFLLGMKANEHEFKVMGLAPYAKKEHSEKLLPFFRKLLRINSEGSFESNLPIGGQLKFMLRDKLGYHRFDTVAGAIQAFTEEIVLQWIQYWIHKTNIHNVGLSGGVFMNVKLNQKIAELDTVERVVVTPSGGDESLIFGGCYAAWQKTHSNARGLPPTLTNLYLGTHFSESEIEHDLRSCGAYEKFSVEKPANIEQRVAELLAKNEVVARFAGKMEFGARALGNRSILSNPSSYENVRIINEMIKNRDFWMPFAASVLVESAPDYFLNTSKSNGSFMAITYETTERARTELQAAIHPYDKTCRPQLVEKSINPSYHALISHFKSLTGIGGILNTSFNLHGEPNVESPYDALRTLELSGLKYLAIGPFLVSKKS